MDVDHIARARQIDVEHELHLSRPPGHHDDAVGERDRLVQIVGDEDDGCARLFPKAQHLRMHPRSQLRVEAAERLVHEISGGAVGERTRDHDTLQHPARQLARPSVLEACEPNLNDGLTHTPLDLHTRDAAEFQRQPNIRRDVAPGQAVVLLRYVSNVAVRTMHRAAAVRHRARVWRERAGDEVEQRRLSATARPDDDEKFAPRNLKADRPHREKGAELDAHVAERDLRSGSLFGQRFLGRPRH